MPRHPIPNRAPYPTGSSYTTYALLDVQLGYRLSVSTQPRVYYIQPIIIVIDYPLDPYLGYPSAHWIPFRITPSYLHSEGGCRKRKSLAAFGHHRHTRLQNK